MKYEIVLWFVADNRSEVGLTVFISKNLVVIEIFMIDHDNVVSIVHASFLADDTNTCSHSVFKLVGSCWHHFTRKLVNIVS